MSGDPQHWPEVHAQPVPAFDVGLVPPNAPLGPLARALFFAVLALGKELGQSVPDFSPDATINCAEGLAIMREQLGHEFPNLGGQE